MQKIKKQTMSQPVQVAQQKKSSAINRSERPTAKSSGSLSGLIDNAKKALKKAGFKAQADEMEDRCLDSGDYDEVLSILNEYVIIDD
ncbi:MAG: hypothetical protein K0Q47_80 [Sedimentibacter sp.]|jgi:uncharacterized protein YqgV (UPF0045/DUF77 family)|nr:hypothetical protein [Sedimentibacter sp.]